MSKQAGMGDHFLFGGYLIGGAVQALSINGGPNLLDVTDITQSAHSRLGGLRSGAMAVTAYMNPSAGQEHAALSPMSRSDVIATYLRGQAIGNPAACCNAVQLNYDPTRPADGSLTEKVDLESDAYGLEWGEQLTAGARTDTTATNGASQNDLAATAFGAQAYLQAVALTGSTVTVTIQHSPDNSTWSTLVAFAAVTSAPGAQRVSIANNATVDQYVRAITAGTFTSFEFQATLVRNKTAVVF